MKALEENRTMKSSAPARRKDRQEPRTKEKEE